MSAAQPQHFRREVYLRNAGREPGPDYIHRFRLPREIETLIRRTAYQFSTTLEEIQSGIKPTNVMLARRSCIHKLRKQGFSLSQIGRWLRVHHTSVLYALQKPNPRSTGYFVEPEPADNEVPCPDLSGEWAI